MGVIGFGGPAAHIAMMHREVVEQRQWLTEQEFLDLLGATNLIPGPNSTEMAIHIGHRVGRISGMLLAGACFICPAFLTTTIMAMIYVQLGKLPQFEALIYGIKPAVLAIILAALWKLAGKAISTIPVALIAGVVIVVEMTQPMHGLNEVVTLLATGIVGTFCLAAIRFGKSPPGGSATKLSGALLLAGLGRIKVATAAMMVVAQSAEIQSAEIQSGTSHAVPFSLLKLTLFFLKVGAILYGGGYVLIAFLEGELVNHYAWITQQELLDAIAIGQFTPGPILTTATFIGYLVTSSHYGIGWGIAGAALCTIGIFLPSFFFVWISGPLIPKLRGNRWAAAFLDSVNAASFGLMTAVTVRLAWLLFIPGDGQRWIDLPGLLITVAATVAVFKWKVNSAWVVCGGAVTGMIFLGIRPLLPLNF